MDCGTFQLAGGRAIGSVLDSGLGKTLSDANQAARIISGRDVVQRWDAPSCRAIPVFRRGESLGRTRCAVGLLDRAVSFSSVDEFYDAAVSGADAIDTRPGFAAMLKRIEGNGVRTIIVETANRFARDLMVQEVGYAMLRGRGINLIAADNPSSFLDDTPTAKLVRQVLGAIAEFDKTMTVAKLRGARERIRVARGKCEGRKSHAERNPELVAAAKRLHRKRPKGGRMSLRAISAGLAALGYLNENGRPYAAASVKAMI